MLVELAPSPTLAPTCTAVRRCRPPIATVPAGQCGPSVTLPVAVATCTDLVRTDALRQVDRRSCCRRSRRPGTWSCRSMPFSTFKPLNVVCCAICVISAICCCTWLFERGAIRSAVRTVGRFDRQGANALQVVHDGVQSAGGGLGFRHGIVRIADGLIRAVDLRGELLTDRETRGIVGGAVDAQTG